MGLPQIQSRNTTQQNIGETLEGRVTNSNTGLYTVPAGKTTKVISFSGVIDGTGADASTAIAIKRGSSFRPVGAFVGVNAQSIFVGELILEAGDIITDVGDSGATNGGVDIVCTIIEL